MTRKFYTALDALLMSRYHGMTFETKCGNPASGDLILLLIDNATPSNLYPDAAGLALLRPRSNDLLRYQGRSDTFSVVGEDLSSYAGCEIIQRDGKPFIMPSREE